MKTFEPPLEALVGRELTGVRRVGKMPVVEFGDLALLIHLMSAGRLRVFDKRASPKDRASRVLVRLEDGRELRLREFGTKQRAWAKLLPADAVAADEMVAHARAGSLAPSPARGVRRRDRPSRATCTRCCATRKTSPASAAPGSTRSSGRRASRPSRRARNWSDGGGRAPARGAPRPRRRDRPLRGDDRRRGARQSADAAPGPQARGAALPALRDDDRGGLLLRTPDELLPEGADGRAGAQRPAAVQTAQVGEAGEVSPSRNSGRFRQRPSPPPARAVCGGSGSARACQARCGAT